METVNALDTHGESWRSWVLENVRRECSPMDMLRAMTKNVWESELAQDAIDLALAELNMPKEWRYKLPRIGPNPQIVLDGVTVDVLARIKRPHAVLFGGVLTPAECAELVDYARTVGMVVSGVVDNQTGSSITHEARTSSGIGFNRATTPLLATLEMRLAQLTNWPITHGEGIQILRYEPGQQYKPHFDWFDPTKTGSAKHLNRGGQRVGTTVVYLSLPKVGGQTIFPKSGVEVTPTLGGAIFFNNVDFLGIPDPLSLHGGAPVIQGEKIVATYWQRESAY